MSTPKFGTSGLRGLVTALTPDCVGQHVTAFIASCPVGTGIYIGHDLRPSSPEIAEMVASAAMAAGVHVTMCGAVPTPALALGAMSAGAAAVMITGSHIPADRNGLKFYTPAGEITKAHEQAILAALGKAVTGNPGTLSQNDQICAQYNARYIAAYGQALEGMQIGLYAHSAVGRDQLADLLTALGAEVVILGWSDTFIPVDTEAVSPALRVQLRKWAAMQDLAAIVSTDGDGDRPLVTDANGIVVPGDILGQITAQALGAETAVTPVSSNTGVDQILSVRRTKIGSPYVIAGMEACEGKIVGYEANGGFLLGFSAQGPNGPLPPLMTRDAVLPMLAVLSASRQRSVAELVADQPARFTAADRLQNVATDKALALVHTLSETQEMRAAFLRCFEGQEAEIDQTDGLRITLQDSRIVHLRPSGNAPELRLYVETDNAESAQDMLRIGLADMSRRIEM